MEDTLKTFEENFSVLPPEIQQVITDGGVIQKTETISNNQGLTPDQTTLLKDEIFFVLFGLEPLSKLRSNLVEKLDINYDKALKVSFDANTQIFAPIMSLLKELEEEIQATASGTELEEETEKTEGDPANVSTEPMKPATTPTSGVTPPPDHMLPSHEMMPGLHVHSQTVMPTAAANPRAAMAMPTRVQAPANVQTMPKVMPKIEKSVVEASPTPAPTPSPVQKQGFIPHQFGGSIVDQKLSKLVRTERGETTIRDDVEERRKAVYKDVDPYREPTN